MGKAVKILCLAVVEGPCKIITQYILIKEAHNTTYQRCLEICLGRPRGLVSLYSILNRGTLTQLTTNSHWELPTVYKLRCRSVGDREVAMLPTSWTWHVQILLQIEESAFVTNSRSKPVLSGASLIVLSFWLTPMM